MNSTDITPQHIYAAAEELKRQKKSRKKPRINGFGFDMKTYPMANETKDMSCGTPCCIWGWAQLIASGEEELKEYFVDEPGIEWWGYSNEDPERSDLEEIMSNDGLKAVEVISQIEAVEEKYHG